MSKTPSRIDRAHSASASRTRHSLQLHAEQLEVRAMLAGDALPQADLLEAEAAGPVITFDENNLRVAEGELATATGTYFDASAEIVSIIALEGDFVDNGDGTWSLSYLVPENTGGAAFIILQATNAEGAEGYGTLVILTDPAAETYLTIGDSVATTDEFGAVAMLPADLEIVSEWDSFTVNVWVRRDRDYLEGITDVSLNLNYNSAWFQLDSYTPSGGVGQLDVIDTGDALEIDASQLNLAAAASGEYLLIGGFRFAPANPEGSLSNDVDGAYQEPADLPFSLDNVVITTADSSEIPGYQVGAPATQLQVVPYDTDDDGVISLVDLTNLIRKLGNSPAQYPSNYKFDFDRDGFVSLIDLAYLIRNIGNSVSSGGSIRFPNYHQPPAAAFETESLVAKSSSTLLEAEAITPRELLSSPSDEAANIDAAFGNLATFVDCWEPPTNDEEPENLEPMFLFDHTPWRPNIAADWALHASAAGDCVVDDVVELLDELEEEFPRLERFVGWLESRLEDR